MKGIRKLFLGLILLTLFCVGFKAEVKAATLKLDDQLADSSKVYPIVKLDNTDFPAANQTIIRYLGIKISNSTPNIEETKPLYLSTSSDGKSYSYSYDDNTYYDYTIGDELYISFSSSELKTMITNALSGAMKDHCIKIQAIFVDDSDVSKANPTPSNGLVIADEIKLFGQYQKPSYSVGYGESGGKFEYTNQKNTDVSNVVKFKIDDVEYDPNVRYFIVKGISTKITIDTDPDPTKYVFKDWESTNDTSLDDDYTFLGTDTGKLNTINANYTKILVILPTEWNLYKGSTISDIISPIYDDDYFIMDNLTISAVSDRYYDAVVDGEDIELTPKAKGSSVLTVTPDFGTLPLSPDKYDIKITVKDSSPIDLDDDVYANVDLSVNLKNFLSYDDDKTKITVTDNTGGVLTFNPSSKTGAINSFTITGKKSGVKKNGISIGSDSANVTVYPKPTLEKTSSSSSSDSTSSYKFKVTMPKGVYHDNTTVKDLSKATLVFTAKSGNDKKYKESVSLSSSSSSDLTKEKEVSKTVKELTKIFRDVCSDSEDTVYVKAYAHHGSDYDDKVVSNEESFKVYKITLDETGGATYTVNGETTSGYFYGIDGVSYKVEAKGTGNLDKTKSSSEFASGSNSITVGVNGARTLKAVYGGNGSNSNEGNGSGGSDDYDDVPKTGESKADIWILWTVLFIAILGAGFMIWKRFGLVRAIAAAEEEYAIAEEEERIETEKKEKEDKLNMLKDLRNL